jgi:hypothetical protein
MVIIRLLHETQTDLFLKALTAYIKKIAPKDQLQNLIPSYGTYVLLLVCT